MKTIIIFACLIAISVATIVHKNGRIYETDEENPLATRYLTVVDENGNIHVEDLLHRVANVRAWEREVKIYLYTQKDMEVPQEISSDDFYDVFKTNFNPNKKTKFIIHGWNNNKNSSVNSLIKEALLDNYDINVFVVDWSTMSYLIYPLAKDLVPYVGQIVGDFITFLVKNYHTAVSDFSIVGHSLGAHVAGKAGSVVKQNIGQKIDHIVALDPAKPLFDVEKIDERVDITDANYVQVIHSSGTLLGFVSAIGHADFYPNGGMKQKGCGLDLGGTCSHGRAYEYYAESLTTSGFLSHNCFDYEKYKKGKCHNNRASYMGEYEIDKTASGDYFLQTNPEQLYAKHINI